MGDYKEILESGPMFAYTNWHPSNNKNQQQKPKEKTMIEEQSGDVGLKSKQPQIMEHLELLHTHLNTDYEITEAILEKLKPVMVYSEALPEGDKDKKGSQLCEVAEIISKECDRLEHLHRIKRMILNSLEL